MGVSVLIFIAFISFLAYNNGARAKFKGRSAALYAFLTLVLFFVGMFIGEILVLVLFHRDLFRLAASANVKDINEMSVQFSNALISNPFHSVTIELLGFGGYLLVRYIIEQFPDKNNKMPLWPNNDNPA